MYVLDVSSLLDRIGILLDPIHYFFNSISCFLSFWLLRKFLVQAATKATAGIEARAVGTLDNRGFTVSSMKNRLLATEHGHLSIET